MSTAARAATNPSEHGRGRDNRDNPPTPTGHVSERSPLMSSPDVNTSSKRSGLTARALIMGFVMGSIICPTNIYFGLQTGHITGFPLAVAAISKVICPSLRKEENAVVVAVSTPIGSMPIVAGLVGVIPALEYLIEWEAGGPLDLKLRQLLPWTLSVCFFGPFLAMKLREQFLVRLKLLFPWARLIVSVLQECHAGDMASTNAPIIRHADDCSDLEEAQTDGSVTELVPSASSGARKEVSLREFIAWAALSGCWALFAHAVPYVYEAPLFGRTASTRWLWNVNVSFGVIGLGIITGARVAYDMALGAIFGWGALSWISRANGWAPGPIGDWETGVQGWIQWPGLAALLADCVVKLSWMKPKALGDDTEANVIIEAQGLVPSTIPSWMINFCLALSIVFCTALVRFSIGSFMAWPEILFAIALALPLSLLGIQTYGQTGVNLVSALGKVSQFVFAAIVTRSNPHALLINLIAGAIAEAGASQAPDLMGDLKAGQLLGLSPDYLLKAQLAGSVFGALVAPPFYKLFTGIYLRKPKPGTDAKSPFKMPQAHMWIVAAKLALGQGLPEKAKPFSIGTGTVFAAISVIKICFAGLSWLPDGTSFAIAIYNVPGLTIPWMLGGLIRLGWTKWKGEGGESRITMVASGLMVGEGVLQLMLMLYKVIVQLAGK